MQACRKDTGIDILASATTPVFSRQAGRVRSVFRDPMWAPFDYFIVVENSDGNGWNYIHIVPGNKPAGNDPSTPADRPWDENDEVKVGDRLGTVAPAANPDLAHLHLDRGGGVDDTMAGHPVDAATRWRRPVTDPLSELSPRNDSVSPVVNNDIHFRVAQHDRNSDNLIFGGGFFDAYLEH